MASMASMAAWVACSYTGCQRHPGEESADQQAVAGRRIRTRTPPSAPHTAHVPIPGRKFPFLEKNDDPNRRRPLTSISPSAKACPGQGDHHEAGNPQPPAAMSDAASLDKAAVLPHDHRGHVVIIVGAVMTVLATITVLARLYTRYFIIHHIGVDDWMAILSLVQPPPVFMLSTPDSPLTIHLQVFAHAMSISQSINATGLLGSHSYDIKNFPVEFPEFLKVSSPMPVCGRRAQVDVGTDTAKQCSSSGSTRSCTTSPCSSSR